MMAVRTKLHEVIVGNRTVTNMTNRWSLKCWIYLCFSVAHAPFAIVSNCCDPPQINVHGRVRYKASAGPME